MKKYIVSFATVLFSFVALTHVVAAQQSLETEVLQKAADLVIKQADQIKAEDLADGRVASYGSLISSARSFATLAKDAKPSKALVSQVGTSIALSKVKLTETLDTLKLRLKSIEESPATGMAFGIDLAEAQSMLKAQLRRQIMTLEDMLSRTEKVEKQLNEIA